MNATRWKMCHWKWMYNCFVEGRQGFEELHNMWLPILSHLIQSSNGTLIVHTLIIDPALCLLINIHHWPWWCWPHTTQNNSYDRNYCISYVISPSLSFLTEIKQCDWCKSMVQCHSESYFPLSYTDWFARIHVLFLYLYCSTCAKQ